jgi:hypothetical protein
MATLTRDADTNEEVIKIDDLFDTFYTKSEINAIIFMPLSGGTFSGNVSMGNYILAVPTPALPNMPSGINGFDDVNNVDGLTYMPLSGGTFTGNVSMGNNVLTVPTNAISGNVDTNEIIYMPRFGGTFTGNVSMGNNILTVPTPALPALTSM